jgi:hypothetical protein
MAMNEWTQRGFILSREYTRIPCITRRPVEEQGLQEIPHDISQSMYGGSTYHKRGKEPVPVPGKDLGPMVTIVWNEMERAFGSLFVMDQYHPKGDKKNHHLRRAASMQRLFIDIQI